MISRIIRSIRIVEADPVPWSVRAALVTVLVAAVAFIAGTLFVVNLVGQGPLIPLLSWSVGGLVTTVYVWLSRRDHRAALRLGAMNARLFIPLLFGVGMAIVIDTLILALSQQFLPAPELLNLLFFNPGPAGWLVAALFMVVIQPIAEELVFRGVVFPTARSRLGGVVGWLFSAVLYASFHLFFYASDLADGWFTFVTPLLVGLFLGGVRANTRSTGAAIAAHMGFGIFALIKLIAIPI